MNVKLIMEISSGESNRWSEFKVKNEERDEIMREIGCGMMNRF
jgi:hypothetical protein